MRVSALTAEYTSYIYFAFYNLPGEVFTTDPSPTMRSFSIHYQGGNRPWWGGKYLLYLIRLTHKLPTITAAPFFALFQLCRKEL